MNRGDRPVGPSTPSPPSTEERQRFSAPGLRRGEIWTLRDNRYAAKARPVLVVQSDLSQLDSVVLCLLTSFERPDAERPRVEPTPDNGLIKTSYVMADKLVTVRQDELGTRVGVLTEVQMRAVSRQLARVLAITQDDLDSR